MKKNLCPDQKQIIGTSGFIYGGSEHATATLIVLGVSGPEIFI